MLNRHQSREKLIFVLYQHLLLHKDLYECFYANFEEEEKDEFAEQIINDIAAHEQEYIEEIGSLLVRWSFDRLNLVEQAILLETVSEIKLKLNDKPVVIDEAVIFAKEYGDDESYRYINGVLDKIC